MGDMGVLSWYKLDMRLHTTLKNSVAASEDEICLFPLEEKCEHQRQDSEVK